MEHYQKDLLFIKYKNKDVEPTRKNTIILHVKLYRVVQQVCKKKNYRFETATNQFVHMQNKLPLFAGILLELWAPQSHDTPTNTG